MERCMRPRVWSRRRSGGDWSGRRHGLAGRGIVGNWASRGVAEPARAPWCHRCRLTCASLLARGPPESDGVTVSSLIHHLQQGGVWSGGGCQCRSGPLLCCTAVCTAAPHPAGHVRLLHLHTLALLSHFGSFRTILFRALNDPQLYCKLKERSSLSPFSNKERYFTLYSVAKVDSRMLWGGTAACVSAPHATQGRQHHACNIPVANNGVLYLTDIATILYFPCTPVHTHTHRHTSRCIS